MKKYLFFLLLASIALLSCKDDDSDDSFISIGTVENPDNSPNFYLKTDNNVQLYISSTENSNYRPQTGQRVLADMTFIDESVESATQRNVRLNGAYNILTKNIFYITPETQDSIGRDLIGIHDIWIGGGYLNVRFFYYGGYKVHFINLIKDDRAEYNDDKVHLEFRHNAYGDIGARLMSGWASFNLSSLDLYEGRTLAIHVEIINYGERIFDLVYDPEHIWATGRTITKDEYNEGKETEFD